MILTIFDKSFCCTLLFGKSEHHSMVRYVQKETKVGFCFTALPKARYCIAFWTVSPIDLLRTSCHWRIKARQQVRKLQLTTSKKATATVSCSMWGSAPSKEMTICGQYGRNRVEEDKWDRSRCKIAAYLSFKEDAGQLSEKHTRNPGMYSALSVFYRDL